MNRVVTLLLSLGLVFCVARSLPAGEEAATAEKEAEMTAKKGEENSESAETTVAGTPMTKEAMKSVLDKIFAKQREIRYLTAKVITTRITPERKRRKVTVGMIKAEVPNLIYFEDWGNPKVKDEDREDHALTLLDGTWLWERFAKYKGEAYEVERRSWQLAAKEGRGLSLVSLLVGKDVHTVDELYDEFELTGEEVTIDGKTVYHFTLKPLAAKAEEGKTGKTIELWFRKDEILPCKVRTVKKVQIIRPGAPKDEKPKLRTKIEDRELEDVKTNLSGLKQFDLKLFLFELKDKMEVRDQKGTVIAPAQLKKDLDAVKKKLEESRKPKAK